MKYQCKATVLSVEERHETARGHLDENKQPVLERASLGWFIRYTESSAIRVGVEKPDCKPGDTLLITLETISRA